MPCPLPSTNRTLGFGSSKLSPCLIDNACALDDHSKVAQTALQHPVPNFRDGFGYIGKKGKLVDKDSLLRNGTLLTQTGGKMLLQIQVFNCTLCTVVIMHALICI